jgi:hypothetical protein
MGECWRLLRIKVGVLVATDIAARGIDIDQLPLLSTLIYQIFPKHTFIE